MSDMDKRRVAETILNLVGGADNVKEVTHCFTRLRFVLKDERIPKDEEVSRAEGVISVVRAGGQYQVVCGTKVQGIYQELEDILREKRSGGGAPSGAAPTSSPGATPTSSSGATPTPLPGASPAPTSGASSAPTSGASPAPTQGASPAPAPGALHLFW